MTHLGHGYKPEINGEKLELEVLAQHGNNLIMLDKGTTGDGLVCALQVLAIMKETGKPLSELASGMPKYPQTMVNVRTSSKLDLDSSGEIQSAVAAAENELADTGRVVLRASGTEPVIRVMVEGQDHQQVVNIADRLAAVVADSAGR
jgi:phosphoglucosamine mutase